MAKPWEQYQAPATEQGPWSKYQAKEAPEPKKEDTGVLDNIYGAGEVAATIGTAFAGDVVGGIAGLGTSLATQDAGKGVEVIDAVRDALTREPKSEAGKEMLQSIGNIEILQDIASGTEMVENKIGEMGFDTKSGPLRTALAVAVPTALGEWFGGRIARIASRVAKKTAAKAASQADEITEQAATIDAQATPTDAGLEQVVESVTSGNEPDVAQAVQADPEFYKAADELGLSTEPLASFASQNPQFRALEQGLAAIPASQLDAQGKQFVSELSQKADGIIQEYGGTLDKAELSDRFRNESLASVDDLTEQADNLYESLGKSIPKNTRIEATNTINLINQKVNELGGFKELPPLLKKLNNSLKTKTKKGELFSDPVLGTRRRPDVVERPTHERLNQLRREVGQAIGKRSGPFKNSETGLLKQVYSVLRRDQDAVAELSGVSDVSKAADALVSQRKQIEDNLSKLLGKDLSSSLLPKVGRSVKQLAKGEIQQFTALMDRIPKKMRKEVVVSSLNDIFRGSGVNKQSLDVTQFSKFMDDLNRSPQLKSVLFRELPVESQKSLQNLAKVSKGISVALQDKIPTGRIAAFFDDNNGFLSKMIGKGIATAATAKAGPLAGDAVSQLLSGSSTSKAKTASDFMASPKFQSIIRDAVKEGVTDGNRASEKIRKAERLIQKSDKYKKWADSLDDSQAAQLAGIGLVNYLLSPPQEQNQQPRN